MTKVVGLSTIWDQSTKMNVGHPLPLFASILKTPFHLCEFIALETLHPLTGFGSHANLKRAVVEGYSLVYTLPGSHSNLKPLMLAGHLDVVPAYVVKRPLIYHLTVLFSLTALDRWTYPPFEGKISGDWIYGRGAGDCKNNVIGILSAVEHLLEEGWVPQRTLGKVLLLAFPL